MWFQKSMENGKYKTNHAILSKKGVNRSRNTELYHMKNQASIQSFFKENPSVKKSKVGEISKEVNQIINKNENTEKEAIPVNQSPVLFMSPYSWTKYYQ